MRPVIRHSLPAIGSACIMSSMSEDSAGYHFELRGVSKSFKQPLTNPFRKRTTIQALAGVSLRIPRREVTCLLGPNGAGKTTLIKILASLITPDSGDVLYDGLAQDSWGRSVQGKIGLVTPNDRSFYWRLTGRQNLMFFGSLYSLRGQALKERVGEALSDAGLTEDADKPYRLYSSGMKQKLNIARALVGDPELYLLDEPAAHLDPLARNDFWEFVEKTLIGKRGSTVFLCTHDLEEAKRLADLIVILHRGQIVDEGPIASIGGRAPSMIRMEFLHSGDAPPAWLERNARIVSRRERNRIVIEFDPGMTGEEALIRSFVAEGGMLSQAYRVEADLLDLLEKEVRDID
jgi:ABC-2 type transport system ATP-binding protein